MVTLPLGFLGGSSIKVDMDGVVKKTRVTSGLGLQVMTVGYLCVSGICVLQLYCGTWSKLC